MNSGLSNKGINANANSLILSDNSLNILVLLGLHLIDFRYPPSSITISEVISYSAVNDSQVLIINKATQYSGFTSLSTNSHNDYIVKLC